jgi:hypothetical protein
MTPGTPRKLIAALITACLAGFGVVVDRTCRRGHTGSGVNLTWRTYLGEHVIGIVAGAEDSFRLVQDRVAGLPATSNC